MSYSTLGISSFILAFKTTYIWHVYLLITINCFHGNASSMHSDLHIFFNLHCHWYILVKTRRFLYIQGM